MNRLRELELSAEAKWRLAAAYQLAGQPEVGKKLVSGAPTLVKAYSELSGTYGSELRDEAMMLEALVLLGDPQAQSLAQRVSKRLTNDEWLSTQETAYSLVAMARYVQKVGSEPFNFTWSLDGGAPATVNSTKPLVQVPLPVKDGTRPKLALQNASGAALFPVVRVSGLPAVGEDRAASNGLLVGVDYGELDPALVEHGTDFTATVTVTNNGSLALQELALTHIVPSGWEIHGVASGTGPEFDYRDVRDDRVYTYFDLGAHESKTFEIRLNAAYQGSFYLPPISVEAMYDANLNGRTAGEWVQVERAGGEG
jgi:uncharacterized protein YfaS (alpha-2-macroglobulin family)